MIDFPQAVDLGVNPNALDLLHHDVTTMCTWFARRGLDCDGEAAFATLLAEAW
jgi:RIO kinase 1